MYRLASFLAAMWLSSAAAHPGFIISDVTNQIKTEVQAGIDPIGKTLAFIGGGLCKHVKPIVGVADEDFDEEPDMSHLTLVFMNKAKTVIYNLTEAANELPKESWYDPKTPLKIYLHGFIDNPKKRSFQAVNNVFAEEAAKGEVNILALDSSSLIAFFYLRATTMVRFIGETLGETLAALFDVGLEANNIHLIGHSLGSHIAGFTGQTFLSKSGSRVGRISGLDPAGPCFGNLDPDLRLSKEDADFVDIMHTDAGVFGLDEEIGHVDYWPNGGEKQPGCVFQTCCHSRAWEFYTQSVKSPELFLTVKCDSYRDFRHGRCDYNDTSLMGYGSTTDSRGNYYSQTLNKEPYGDGEKGLKFKENEVVSAAAHAIKHLFAR